MKHEQGIVTKIDSDSIFVKLTPNNSDECASCGCCQALGNNEHILKIDRDENSNLINIKQGSKVTVEINLPNKAVAGFLLFGIPLINMIIFGIASAVCFPEKNTLFVVGGGLGLVAGVLEVSILNKVVPALKKGIKVVEVND